MKKIKEHTKQQLDLIDKYPIGSKVKYKIDHWNESTGVIIKYTDKSKLIVRLRDVNNYELVSRSLNHLEYVNENIKLD